ncbi:MAG: BsaWI family type II restriction enzyme, partial [Armatimonadota bacterium]
LDLVSNLWDEPVDTGGIILGDVDIGVVKAKRAIIVVSCKLSLHNRLTETLFYSLLYYQKGIRVVLATPDKGQAGRSEWGTLKRPTKNRLLARCFLSGVYIGYDTGLFPPPEVRAEFGDVVRPLEDLPKDIQRWFP